MQKLFADTGRSLPDTLLDDLEELVSWDNNCYLTWSRIYGSDEPEDERWFRVRYSSDGLDFGLRLEFWIPAWMPERGVAAILPAHLGVFECRAGVRAAVDLGMQRRSDLRRSLPRVARTCARLINELWGATGGDEVLLSAMDYQAEVLPVPFPELPTYSQ